jgi:putative ABC transport system permease protein
MMNFGSIFGITRLAINRIFSQLGLMLALTLGMAVVVMLASAIPTFSDAVQLRLLREKFDAKAQAARNGDQQQYPPFAFMLTFLGSGGKAIEYEEYISDDGLVSQQLPDVLQLPITRTARYVHTRRLSLFPEPTDPRYNGKQVGSGKFSVITEFDNHIEVFGERPQLRDDGVIEILMDNELANDIGANVGERYELFDAAEPGKQPQKLTVLISGIWAAKDPDDDFWFFKSTNFKDGFMVSQAQYEKQVAPQLKQDTEFALWYYVTDGSALNPETGTALLQRLNRFETDLAKQRDGLDIRVSPEGALRQFVRSTNDLTLLLVIYSVPLLAAALYFIGMVAGMVVQRQAGEIAVLRSRGASSFSIALLYIIGGALLGALALGIGLAAGLGLAAIMTRLRSFLTLAEAAALPVQLSPLTVRFGVAAAFVGLLASLLPAIAASRKNVLAYRSAQSRALKPPLWQRLFLDVMLFVIASYSLYQMRLSGGILPVLSRQNTNPFADPVRFLAPVLMLAACALLLARVFPYAMRFLAWSSSKVPTNTAILLALRSLARAPSMYIGPLLLLIFTVGLAVFSASIAYTLDQHLVDSSYFRVGADMRFVEIGVPSRQSSSVGVLGGTVGESNVPTADQPETLYYTFVPVEEHLRIPGVRNATRIGHYEAAPKVQNAPGKAIFVGVDRVNYAQIAYHRPDFAPQTVGVMMNELAINRSALYVPTEFLAQNRLRLGEPLRMDVSTAVGRVPVTFTLAGTYDLWPYDYAIYKKEARFFVGNLDWFFEQAGTELPYDVLLSTDPDANVREVSDRASTLGYNVSKESDARLLIREAQKLPERQGLFGLLSAGFIAASLLTIIGFVLSALISFRARAIQLGMLRTVGLSAAQMGIYISLEQIVLIGLGTLAGSGLGLLISRLFIPFLQVGGAGITSQPPFAVRIAWSDVGVIYVAIGVALALALLIMLALLRRLKAFEAIKLGAT